VIRLSVRQSACLSRAPISKQRILGLWLIQNTNKKAHAGSRTHWSAWSYDHRKWPKRVGFAVAIGAMQAFCSVTSPPLRAPRIGLFYCPNNIGSTFQIELPTSYSLCGHSPLFLMDYCRPVCDIGAIAPRQRQRSVNCRLILHDIYRVRLSRFCDGCFPVCKSLGLSDSVIATWIVLGIW